MSTWSTIPAEHQDLATHVDLCAQRYQALDQRMESLELKVDSLVTKVDDVKNSIFTTLITTGGTIIVALIGAVFTIISHIK